MESDAPRSAADENSTSSASIKLHSLPVIFGVATVSTVIVAAMYGVAGEFFLDVGKHRAAGFLALAVIAALALAGASLATTIGLLLRARWAWFLAVAITGVWTANGIRVLLERGFYVPASLVTGLAVAWALWDEREAFDVTAELP